ncbi:urea transporter [Paenibacillus favisporus]|uniref:Urea transporter n=1 Tax=Paenibacillus favisporus TaxID=221028 RepID=A0ABV2F6P6_9BACL
MMLKIERYLFGAWRLPAFAEAVLKGISQVILVENTVSGLLILIAILISSVRVGLIALLSACIATLIGWWGGADRDAVKQGLLGYNSVLAGISLSLYLGGSDRWVIALAGAAAAALLTAAMMHAMRGSGLPVLTLPFIVVTWFLLMASYRLSLFRLSPDLAPQDLSHWTLHPEGAIHLFRSLVDGVGQVYFQDGIWPCLLIWVAVLWGNWRLGIYAAIGSIAGWLTALGLGAEISLMNLGLYGYNAVLTILAVGAVFDAKSRWALLTGLIAAAVTVPVTAGIDTWILPYGLPALTLPFVLSTWLFLAARKVLPNL